MAQAGVLPPAQPHGEQSPAIRKFIFFYDVAWLVGLLIIAAVYLSPPAPLKPLVAELTHVLGGSGYILSAIWFAVLGDLALSFRGVYEHTRPSEWPDGQWNLWYFGRPVSGIIVGVMTYWLLKAVTTSTDPSYPALVVASFTLGTQESKFFAFLAQVANLILTVPADRQAGLRIDGVRPSQGSAGTSVIVYGQGMHADCAITFGGRSLVGRVVNPEGTSAAGIVPQGLAPGPADIVVTNPDATANARHQGFLVTAAAP